jgi:hypothetical protein
VLLFQNNDDKALTIGDILRSTNNFDQTSIIGCGGFGLVYTVVELRLLGWAFIFG